MVSDCSPLYSLHFLLEACNYCMSKLPLFKTPWCDEVQLLPRHAKIHGSNAVYETAADRQCIGMWHNSTDWISWDQVGLQSGDYSVWIEQALAVGEGVSHYLVKCGNSVVDGIVISTEGWSKAQSLTVQLIKRLHVPKNGLYSISVHSHEKTGVAVMNLFGLRLKKVSKTKEVKRKGEGGQEVPKPEITLEASEAKLQGSSKYDRTDGCVTHWWHIDEVAKNPFSCLLLLR